MKIFSKENVTFLIAVAGFFMSALTLLKEFWGRRNSLELTIIDYKTYRTGIAQFYIQIQNKSSLPASVSKIVFEFRENWYTCELEPKLIKKTPAVCIKTPCFPVTVPPTAFFACYLEFLGVPNMQLSPGTVVSFQIYTSRGILKKSITLSSAEHYLHIT